MTPAERDDFLKGAAIVAKIASTLGDGHPVVTPVWYEWDGSAFFVLTEDESTLTRNLRRDPRCGLLVDSPTPPYRRVIVQGSAQFLGPDFAWRALAQRMALRYLGDAAEGYARSLPSTLSPVRIRPTSLLTSDGGDPARTQR